MTTNTTSQRRYDLDWLRVILIGFVFIFHSGRFFDTGGWHVKNAETFFSVQVWTTFLANWMMPAIFVVSGASLFFALGGSNGKFIKDKVLRLLVPLVVGAFTHVAVQVYLERVTHHQFTGTFFEFLPHYFNGLYGFGGNFAWMGLHLWYLLVLFVFSILLLPLFRWLKGRGARALSKFGDVLAPAAGGLRAGDPDRAVDGQSRSAHAAGLARLRRLAPADLYALLRLRLRRHLARGLAAAHQAAALVVAGAGRHRASPRCSRSGARRAMRPSARRATRRSSRSSESARGAGCWRSSASA